MIRRLVVLLLLVGGAVLLEPLRVPTEGVIAPRSLFLFGILLLTADTFGALAHDLGIPRLVGYLLAGLALGPSVLDVVPPGVLQDLSHDEAAGGRADRAAGRRGAQDQGSGRAVPRDRAGSWRSRPRRCWSA